MSFTSSIVIEILTKSDCCLCDDMKKIVGNVLQDYPAKLVMTDIESDPKLYEKFKERIPLLKIDGIESFVYKANEATLRHKLDRLKNNKGGTFTN
jgi:hypothetical protein